MDGLSTLIDCLLSRQSQLLSVNEVQLATRLVKVQSVFLILHLEGHGDIHLPGAQDGLVELLPLLAHVPYRCILGAGRLYRFSGCDS